MEKANCFLLKDEIEKTMMLGAVCGDIAGSVYEWHNIKHFLAEDKLIAFNARFTDDTVMTCAVAKGLNKALSGIGETIIDDNSFDDLISKRIVESLVEYGRKYPYAGYGGSFRRWIHSSEHLPYNSWGNGSAMRVSYAGWVASSLYEAEHFAELSAAVTHNHPEGIKGAKAVAGIIFLLRDGGSKGDIREYVKKYYNISFTLDEIREDYRFDVSCQGSVPQAIEAFFEGENFSDVISKAISIGGDSDTIAAIAGSIAEAIYPIPDSIRKEVINRLSDELKDTLIEAVSFAIARNKQLL